MSSHSVIEISSDSESDSIENRNTCNLNGTSGTILNGVDSILQYFPHEEGLNSNESSELSEQSSEQELATLSVFNNEINNSYEPMDRLCYDESSDGNLQFPPKPDDFLLQPIHLDEDSISNESSDVSEQDSEQEMATLSVFNNEINDSYEPMDRLCYDESSESSDEKLQFDPKLGSLYGYTLINGNRWYSFGESMVCLKLEQIEELKGMKKTKALGANFVSVLLTAVFGVDVLKQCSAGGRRSNYNKTAHKALNLEKLKFIKDIFEERVRDYADRKKLFVKIVNKKCNNMRRN